VTVAVSRSAGFTLVELVTVLVLSAILGLVVWRNIAEPLRVFSELTRRTDLVNNSETAVARLQRELRLALPNSVRITPDGTSLEFLRTLSGGRYRAEADPANVASDPLDFTRTADSFEVLDQANELSSLAVGGGINACLNGDVDCMAIFKTGEPEQCSAASSGRSNAYCGDNLAGIGTYDSSTHLMTFDRSESGRTFPHSSPTQRFFVVDTPVSYLCSNGELLRYADYPITEVQTAPPAGAQSVLAENVESCRFTYDSGSSSRTGLVTVRLVLADQNLEGTRESVSLMQQVSIPNAP